MNKTFKGKSNDERTIKRDEAIMQVSSKLTQVDNERRELETIAKTLNIPLEKGWTLPDFVGKLREFFKTEQVQQSIDQAFKVLSEQKSAYASVQLLKMFLDVATDKNIEPPDAEPKTANIIVFGEYTGCDES